MPTSAIIVAGGQSRRLGQDKRGLRLWGPRGPTLLERTAGLLAELCDEVVVVLNDPQEWPGLPARLVPDIYADGGALGGICAGLLAARHDYALTVAGDMPLLSRALLVALLGRPRDYDALLPRALRPGGPRNPLGVEPLHAIYARPCLDPIRATLAAGQRQVTAFLPQVNVAYFEPEETRRHDPHGHSFLNINTPEQLAEVRRLIGPAA